MEVRKNQSTMAIQRQSYIGQKKDRGYLQNKVYKYAEQFFFIIKPIIIKIWDKKEFKLIFTKDMEKKKQKKELLLIEKSSKEFC